MGNLFVGLFGMLIAVGVLAYRRVCAVCGGFFGSWMRPRYALSRSKYARSRA